MNPRRTLDEPPRLAAWLLSLFASNEERELIVGDLAEEHLQRASQSGRAAAGRWYWRQVVKTIPYLIGSAFRSSPWKTAVAVAVGFGFRKLIARQVGPAIFAFVDQFHISQNHFEVYRFLASTGIDIGHLLAFFMVGLLVGLIAWRREMAPALALGLIYAGMAVFASVWFVTRSHEFAYLLRLSWYFSDSFAIVLGAAVVRTLRASRMRLAPQA